MIEHIDSEMMRFLVGVVLGFVVTQTGICVGVWAVGRRGRLGYHTDSSKQRAVIKEMIEIIDKKK